ncbi:MAG: hypothetical protein CMK00_09405 [Planctomycetes bacterium]|nr:hypothetical protein [Planctomycetota bacterium]
MGDAQARTGCGTVSWTVFSSSLGEWLVAATERGLCLLSLDVERGHGELAGWCKRHEPQAQVCEGPRQLVGTTQELRAYAAGEMRSFKTPLDLRGTEFQLRVWAGLCEIPHGQTWTYKQLAEHIGAPGSYRAVGGANGRNPVSVIVPCHRVVACGGGLGGYTGGLAHKVRLLAHEGVVLPRAELGDPERRSTAPA